MLYYFVWCGLPGHTVLSWVQRFNYNVAHQTPHNECNLAAITWHGITWKNVRLTFVAFSYRDIPFYGISLHPHSRYTGMMSPHVAGHARGVVVVVGYSGATVPTRRGRCVHYPYSVFIKVHREAKVLPYNRFKWCRRPHPTPPPRHSPCCHA